MSNSFETDKYTLTRVEPDLLEICFKDDVDFNEADALIATDQAFQLAGAEHFKVLTNVKGITGNMTPNAMAYFGKDPLPNSRMKAMAILLDSLPMRILAAGYLRIHTPIAPTRVFEDREEALDWLRQLVVNEQER